MNFKVKWEREAISACFYIQLISIIEGSRFYVREYYLMSVELETNLDSYPIDDGSNFEMFARYLRPFHLYNQLRQMIVWSFSFLFLFFYFFREKKK